jgi:hypothetical protein
MQQAVGLHQGSGMLLERATCLVVFGMSTHLSDDTSHAAYIERPIAVERSRPRAQSGVRLHHAAIDPPAIEEHSLVMALERVKDWIKRAIRRLHASVPYHHDPW